MGDAFPFGWKKVKIREIATVGNGTTPSRQQPKYWGDKGQAWLPTSKVNERIIKNSDEYITSLALRECSIKVVPKGATLIGMIGQGKTRGMAALLAIDAAINQNFAAIVPSASVDSKFLFHMLDSSYRRLRNLSQGSNQGSLNCDLISGYSISLPPLAEQRKIAEILGTWDEAIATVEQLIDALKRRKQGLMQRLLTGQIRFPEFAGEAWQEKEIGEVLEEVRRPVTDFSADSEYHLLSVRRRSQGLFFRETQTGAHLEGKGMFKVEKDDFLISKRQIVHGASGLTDEKHDGYVVSNSYHALVSQDKDKFDIRFFNWLSRTPYLYHLSHVASHGVHIEKLFFTLNVYFRRKIKVPPTIKEQRKIVEALDSVDETIQAYEVYKQKLTVQKKGLMQRLLTGQVRVQVDEG